MTVTTTNPLHRLSPEQIEEIGNEFQAIHDEVLADLGERDAVYIRSMIEFHRRLAALSRIVLMASRYRPAWLLGTAGLSVAKILENMEIGHNVLHGQWDWMNDPNIHSSTWDWDTASPASAWKHSHNYLHHTYTNVVGKDKDVGYDIMRIDPKQPWHPIYLPQPIYNVLLMGLFEWGVAVHDLDFEAIRKGEKPKEQLRDELQGDRPEGAPPDRQGLHRLPAPQRPGVEEDGLREPHRELRPQPVVPRDHLLRPLPRPGLHVHRGGMEDETRGALVRPAAARRGEHRGQPDLPRDEREPELPGGAPPVPGHAQLALPGDRADGSGRSASATACPTTPARSASSGARCSARSCASPSPAGRSAPKRRRGGSRRRLRRRPPRGSPRACPRSPNRQAASGS